METRVIQPQPDGLLSEADLQIVCSALHRGAPVAVPTETVYGLAADALSASACEQIFRAKERPFTDPLICHLPDAASLDRYTIPNFPARRLAETFWPGPLTLVLPKCEQIPDLVTAGMPTVAVRCSAHPLFRQIVQKFGRPLAAPSANRFGRISPTTAQAVCEELGGRIGLVVDGGACLHGVESTIVAVEEQNLRLLRRGPIIEEQLREFAPVIPAAENEVAPGRLPWHYAPTTPLKLLTPALDLSSLPPRRGLLSWRGNAANPGAWYAIEVLSPSGDLVEAAHRLYSCLRKLDAAGLDVLCAEPVPEAGLGRTIMERLKKAAARG